MDAAARMLARGWLRGASKWWWATSAALAVLVVLVLAVVGLFAGMQQESHARIGDVYTSDLRITPVDATAASATPFAPEAGPTLVAELEEHGSVSVRYESTIILSRRSLVEAYLQEDEGYEFQLPGTHTTGDEAYGVALFLGLDLTDRDAVDPLRPYMTAGGFPASGNTSVMQLVLSENRFMSFLSPEEKEGLSWPPTRSALRSMTFEVTSARIDDKGSYKDLIRAPAEVVGLYRTDLDFVDTFTVWGDLRDARALAGHEPNGTVSNAVLFEGDADAARAIATAHGYASEDSASFAARYLGQIVDVLRWLSITLASVFLIVPVFLLWYGMGQQLDKHAREVAVVRAVGVAQASIRRAVARLATTVVGRGLALGGLVAALFLPVLDLAARQWEGSPVPLGIFVSPVAAFILLAAVAFGTVLAVWGALRAHRRLDLAASLRTF